MKLRSEIELPKIKVNDIVRVRIIAVAVKYIIVDLYGKEVKIKVDDLQHTYIYSCKDIYMPGEYLKARVKVIDIQNNIFELSCKELLENPYTNIRKYITENGEYTGRVIAFPKSKSGVIVQLDRTKVTCLTRVPARFDKYPHFFECAKLEHLQCIFKEKNYNFKNVLYSNLVSRKGDVFIHNTRKIDEKMLIALDILCKKLKGQWEGYI